MASKTFRTEPVRNLGRLREGSRVQVDLLTEENERLMWQGRVAVVFASVEPLQDIYALHSQASRRVGDYHVVGATKKGDIAHQLEGLLNLSRMGEVTLTPLTEVYKAA